MSLVRPTPINGTPGSYAPLITRYLSVVESFVNSRTQSIHVTGTLLCMWISLAKSGFSFNECDELTTHWLPYSTPPRRGVYPPSKLSSPDFFIQSRSSLDIIIFMLLNFTGNSGDTSRCEALLLLLWSSQSGILGSDFNASSINFYFSCQLNKSF